MAISEDYVRKVVAHIRKRAKFCIKAKDGHFEQYL